MKRGDEIEAEARVLVATLITDGAVHISCSDQSMVVLVLRRSADLFEQYLQRGSM